MNGMTFSERTGLYRNPYNRWIAGVCSGIAERLGVATIWIRLGTFFAFLAFNIITVVAYAVLAFVMQPRSYANTGFTATSRAQAEPTANVYSGPGMGPFTPQGTASASDSNFNQLKDRFERLDARLSNIESTVISDEFSLRRKFRDLGAD